VGDGKALLEQRSVKMVTGVETFACERYDAKSLLLKWDAVFLSLGSSLFAYGGTEEKAISRAIGLGSMSDADKAAPIAGCIANAIAHEGKLYVVSISFPHAHGVSEQCFSFADLKSQNRVIQKLQTLRTSAEATAIAHDNFRSSKVLIGGATGPNAAVINGPYSPTQERGLDGRIIYCKSSDASVCIEHHDGHWQVKPASTKGTDACRASVTGGCALEACTSRAWKVSDGKALHEQRSVKMVTGAEAELAVSRPCIDAPQETLNPKRPSLLIAACFCSNTASAHCCTRGCTVHVILTRRCDPLPLHRLLHMLLLKLLLLATTTQKLPSSLSAAPQAPMLQSSTGRTHPRKRGGWMGALYTARAAMPPFALNIVQDTGKSSLRHPWARMHALAMSQADAHWRHARHAHGEWAMERRFTISGASKW